MPEITNLAAITTAVLYSQSRQSSKFKISIIRIVFVGKQIISCREFGYLTIEGRKMLISGLAKATHMICGLLSLSQSELVPYD